MRTSITSKSLILGIALLLATSAFASEKATVEFTNRTSVAGTQLTPGRYDVRWDSDGPNVELTIFKNSAVVAKVPAKRVDLKGGAPSNTTTTMANGDGSVSLSQIQFRGKKYAFEIGENSAQAASSTK
jgi:hypothetical protein